MTRHTYCTIRLDKDTLRQTNTDLMVRLRELWASYKDTHPTVCDADDAGRVNAEHTTAQVIAPKTPNLMHMCVSSSLSISVFANIIPNHP